MLVSVSLTATVYATITLLLASGALYSQQPVVQIHVGPNVRVSDLGAPHVEPYIAAHPATRLNLIVAAAHSVGIEAAYVESFYTRDGGANWSVSHLPQLSEALIKKDLDIVADNWLAFSADGSAYCAVVAGMRRGHPWGRVPILFYRSRNQGSTWEGPTPLGPVYDRPTIVTAGSGKDKRVYVAAMSPGGASQQMVTVLRSDDGGVSFPRTTSIAPDNLGHGAMNPVIAPDGSLIVPYVDYALQPDARRLLQSSRIYVIRSTDGGARFGLPKFVAEIPKPLPGSVAMAVNLSATRFPGRLYLAWNGERDERENVIIARSQDNGETWITTSLRAPDAGRAHFASLAVSSDGILGAAWIQDEAEEPRKNCYRTYFAASTDGGESFTAPNAVSDAISCPDPLANKDVITRFERGGDYMGLAVTADGTFHPVWPDGRDGAFQIYTAAVKVSVK